MKVLLDHNLPRRLASRITGHDVATTRQMQWELLRNGALLQSAADSGFEAFVTTDKKLEYEQNLQTLPIAVIVLDCLSNALPHLEPLVPTILACLAIPPERQLYVVQRDGSVICVTSPR